MKFKIKFTSMYDQSLLKILVLILLSIQFVFPIDLPTTLSRKLFSEVDSKDLSINPNSETLDNSIDQATYLVGGGDGFQISIVGLPSQEFFPVINQDGDIFVGDFGLIKLGKITLSKAKEVIREQVQKTLRKKYDVYVSLVRLKKPTVLIGGDLQSTGTIQLSGSMRILDAIKITNKGALPPLEEFNLREVEVRTKDSSLTYDLLDFIKNLNYHENPYIYPGDAIILHRTTNQVTIKGEINGPLEGKIPIKKGETLNEVLKLISFKSSADSNFILIQQFGNDGALIPLRQITRFESKSITVNDRDVISIPSKENYINSGTVLISGDVVRPGTYPILENKTSVQNLLDLAGGGRLTANLSKTYLIKPKRFPGIRDDDSKTENGLHMDNRFPTQFDAAISALRKIRPEDNTALTDLNTLNDCMILDIGDNSNSILVQDGDRIFVPKKNIYVFLSGAVKNPGPYLFKKGESFQYYTDLAGGFTKKSDTKNKFVLSSYQDFSKIRDDLKIDEGDILVIPNVVEYKKFNNLWLPIFQIIPTIISLGISLYIVSNQTK